MAENEKIETEDKKGMRLNEDESIDNVPLFRKKKIIIPALIIIIAAAAGIYWYIGQLGYISTDDAFIDSNKLTVSSKILGQNYNASS